MFYEAKNTTGIITVSPLDNSRGVYKGVSHEDVTHQHPLFVNNSNNNNYFTNYSTTTDLCTPKVLGTVILTV